MGALPKEEFLKLEKGRRAHNALKLEGVSKCPKCGSLKKSHFVCPNCGTYKK